MSTLLTTYYNNGIAQLYQADARQIPLPDQSVHCVVTSPPYYGLRVYRTDSDAMIGLEQTPEQYLASMLEVMDEVWRVLRDDGVLWVNLGDSYGGSTGGAPGSAKQASNSGANNINMATPGQLLGIPWRFALAMQAAGWILRSDVIWAKKSAMPESLNGTRWERCRVNLNNTKEQEYGHRMGPGGTSLSSAQWADCPGCPKCEPNGGYVLRQGSWRCTSAHEYIFQFVKGMGYYCDGEAVKTPHQYDGRQLTSAPLGDRGDYEQGLDGHERWPGSGANRRSVWNDIKPEPFGGEHYATFPSDLPRLCIQASTSEAGVCAQCGNQWARVMSEAKGGTVGRSWHDHNNDEAVGQRAENSAKGGNGYEPAKTLSWRPTCTCNADKVPATVLDCFAGTGTSCLAAMRLGRRSVGVDLSQDYLNMAIKRLSGQTMPMIV